MQRDELHGAHVECVDLPDSVSGEQRVLARLRGHQHAQPRVVLEHAAAARPAHLQGTLQAQLGGRLGSGRLGRGAATIRAAPARAAAPAAAAHSVLESAELRPQLLDQVLLHLTFDLEMARHEISAPTAATHRRRTINHTHCLDHQAEAPH